MYLSAEKNRFAGGTCLRNAAGCQRAWVKRFEQLLQRPPERRLNLAFRIFKPVHRRPVVQARQLLAEIGGKEVATRGGPLHACECDVTLD